MRSLLKKISQLPNYVFVVVFYLATLLLYWPSLHGEPIWDDWYFIFRHPAIISDFPYFKIWTEFAWPLSISLEKLFYQLWAENYFYYHLVNLLLHFFNAYLLLKIIRKMSFPYPLIIFLIFLIHPANVISVSWIFQLKTLLCFGFAALCVLSLLKVKESKKWYFLSWLFYFISLLSKSASVPLGLFLFSYDFKSKTKRDFLWVAPFLFFSILASYQLLKSEVTVSGMEQVKDKDLVVMNETTKVKVTQGPTIVKKEAATVVKPEIKPEAKSEIKPTPMKEETYSSWQMMLATSHYYFWNILLPLEIHPIKGPVPSKNLFIGYGHFLVLILIFFLTWNTRSFWCLLTGYLMLTPFLGILPAPFMNITWVSDQHLYLALPFFVLFWADTVSKVKFKYIKLLPVILIFYFGFQTSRATKLYKDDIVFYSASLAATELNLPIAYNLAEAYLARGRVHDALYLTTKIIFMGKEDQKISGSKYYHHIEQLHRTIINLQKP